MCVCVCVCVSLYIKHFEGKYKYYKKGKNIKHYRLAVNVKPIPTILHPKNVVDQNSEINNPTSPVSISGRSPRKHFWI